MICSFHGEYAFLSNFYKSHIEFVFGSVILKAETVEHAYQACKCLDLQTAVRVLSCKTPGMAKRAGNRVEIRQDWNSIKLLVMHSLLEYKFRSGSILAQKLKATEPEFLVEGNTWGDTFWGQCKGVGENHLGLLLIKIRSTL